MPRGQSQLFRQRIKVTANRVVPQLDEVYDFSVDPPPGATTDQDKLDALKDKLEDLLAHKEKLGGSLNVLYECHRDWTELQDKMTMEDRAEEVAIQEEFMAEPNCNYVQILDRVQTTIDDLRKREVALNKAIRRLESRLAGPRVVHVPAAAPGAAAAAPPLVNLPRMDLPKYAGDVLRWSEFWDLFSSTVDSAANLSARQKFSYLKTCLQGNAAKLIDGLSVTESNYDVAKDLLKGTYGKKDYVIQALYKQLDELPRPQAHASSLRDFMQSLEKICRQLEKQGENLDQKKIVVQLEGKMPLAVLNRIAEVKRTTGTWSTQEFRNTLKNIVELREEVESMQALQIGPSKRDEKNNPGRKPAGKKDFKPAQARPSAAFAVGRKQRPPPKCVFCEDPHFGSACQKYGTLQSRRQRAQQLQYCWRCLKAGHQRRDCTYTYPCVFCKSKDHHSALCDKKQSGGAPVQKTAPRPRQAGRLKGKLRPPRPVQQTNRRVLTTQAEEAEDDGEEDDVTLQLVPEGQWIRASTVVVTSSNSVNERRARDVLLLTARAKVSNPKQPSKLKDAVCFLDNGSQVDFIANEFAKSMGLPYLGQEELALTTLTTKKPEKMMCPVYTMLLQTKDGRQRSIKVYGKDRIIGKTPIVDIKPIRERTPDGKRWLVRVNHESPNVMLGGDTYWDLGVSEVDKLRDGLTILDSELGFMAAGRLGGLSKQLKSSLKAAPVASVNMLMIAPESGYVSEEDTVAVRNEADDNLRRRGRRMQKLPPLSQRQIEKFMKWESIGIYDDPLQASEDEAVMEQFLREVKFRSGRYCVRFPLVSGPLNLPTNYELCMKRLASTYFRLLRDPDVMRQYDAIIRQQLDEGVIELVPCGRTNNLMHYLPHQAVVNMTKKSTKVRVVYDASASVRGSPSLNDCLHRGPVFLADLVGLFLRLRLASIAIMSDIEKAFLQISVHEDHRDLTRFLWLEDVSRGLDPENIVQMRFARVPFGLKSSPFLLTAVLVKHLDDDGGSLAQEIKRSLYMDNVFYTATSVEEAIIKSREATDIFARAGMNLRQFVSNSSEVNKELGEHTETVTKFLGVQWNVQTDVLLPKLPEPPEGAATETKRTVLSLTAAAYDPCGYLAPVTFRAKSFFQSLWKKKEYNWDNPLKQTDVQQWYEITSDWGSQLELPRLIVKGQPVAYQLVCFSDASIKASAAVVYLRTRYADRIQAHVIFAKTKLSPLKTPTIPRLELVGVLMGVRALQFVRTELHLPLELCSVFTDSSCVLNWILSGTENLPTFVLNRTREIRRAVNCAFGFVCTTDNPADVATRGLTVAELRSSNLWWHGPPWIRLDQSSWPEQPRFYSDADKLLRENDLPVMAAQVTATKWPPATDVVDIARFSKLTRLVRSTAYFLRAAVLLLRPISEEQSQLKKLYSPVFSLTDVLSAREVEEATRFLLRQDQRANALTEEERLQWRVQQGPKELLYCADRLQFSSLEDDRKNVVFLTRQSKLLKLYIIHLHEKGFHCGIQQTLASLRQQVYCPRGRQAVRSTIRRYCMLCRRQFAKPYRLPPFPPLPAERTQRADAFLNVGLDYLGPTSIRLPNGEAKKMWVLLLTCLVTRAVHLEIVLELTTAAFLRAFRRFIGRRRKPKVVISDNQTTFTLAAQVVNCGWDAKNTHPDISNFMTTWEIDWRFIPALQPWQGGVYERMVGMFKKAFRVAAGRRVLPLDEAQTLVIEIESLINHRPLFYILDEQDIVILRPIDLVQPGENDPGLAFTVTEDDDDDEFVGGRMSTQAKLLRLQRKEQQDADKFWNSFHDDYLPDQRDRRTFSHKQRHTTPMAPRIGHVVIIKEDNTPRGLWKLGRIVGIRDAHRQQLRTADLQTKSGRVINRSIGQLHTLEVTDEELQRDPQAAVGIAPSAGDVAEDIPNEPADMQAPDNEQPQAREAQPEEEQTAENALEDEARMRINSRYSLRPNPRRNMPFMFAAFNVVVMLLTPLLLAGGTSAAHSYDAATPPQNRSGRCNSNADTKRLSYGSSCQRRGYVVYKDGPAFCYNEYTCPEGMHLRNIGSYFGMSLSRLNTSHFCGQECQCDPPPEPYETEVQGGCSFYKGEQTSTSSVKNWDAQDILHSLKPPYCSFKPTLECPIEHGVHANLVELYDGSFHFVSPLRLVHVQYDAADVRCSEGANTVKLRPGIDVTGTPEFCSSNNCTAGAKTFCSYLGGEKLLIDSPLGQLLIKSWAIVFAPVYLPDHTYHRSRQRNASWHKVKCRKDGFEVASSVAGAQLQVCSGGYCKRFSDASDKEDVTFPTPYLLHPHIVQLKVWKNGHVAYQEEVECPATDICDLISCQFCAAIAHNPRCASAIVIITVTASAVVVCALICSASAFIAYKGVMKWKKRQRRTFFSVRTTDSMELGPVSTSHESVGTHPPPSLRDVEVMTPATERRTKHRVPPFKTATAIALVSLASSAMSCSVTSVMRINSDLCIINSDGHLNCSFTQATSVTVSNQGQRLCFLIKDASDVPYGTMAMTVSPLELVCDPDTRHFVRQFHMEVASSRRCSGMGSCDDDLCGRMNSSVIVPELEAVSMFPGFSKCFSSCGCWGCGCLLCSDGCVFMRLLAKPVYGQRQGRIFECFWHIESKVSVEIHLGNETRRMTLQARLGRQTKKERFILKLNQISLPPLPQLHRRFVTDDFRTATVDPSQKTVTCDNGVTPFRNCHVPWDICGCHEARGVAHCECDESIYVMKNLDSPNHVLPLREGPTWLHEVNGQVVADTFVGTAELRVSIDGLRLALKAYNSSCNITPRKLSGCHSCHVGSKFDFGCQTDQGVASAHVHCPSADFFARCDTSTIWQSQQLFMAKAEIDEQCEVVCVGNTTTFRLHGRLDYAHGSHGNSSSPHTESYTPDFSFSDIPKLLWKFLILPDLRIWLMTASVGILLAISAALGWCVWMRMNKSALGIPLALTTMLPQANALSHINHVTSEPWIPLLSIVIVVTVIVGTAIKTLTLGKRQNSQGYLEQQRRDTIVVNQRKMTSSEEEAPLRSGIPPLRSTRGRGARSVAGIQGRGASFAASYLSTVVTTQRASSVVWHRRGRGPAPMVVHNCEPPRSSTSAKPILGDMMDEQPKVCEETGRRYVGRGFSRRFLDPPPPKGYGKPIPEEYLLDGNFNLPKRRVFRLRDTVLDIVALCDADSLYDFRQASRYCYQTWQTNWDKLRVISFLCGWCNSRNHGDDGSERLVSVSVTAVLAGDTYRATRAPAAVVEETGADQAGHVVAETLFPPVTRNRLTTRASKPNDERDWQDPPSVPKSSGYPCGS